jgi:hypothetical protein
MEASQPRLRPVSAAARLIAAATLAGAVAGCAAPAADTEAWPRVAVDRLPGAPASRGEAGMPVRSLDAAGAEVAAECVATGAGFAATFAAPAVLAVPTRGRESGTVRVDCAAEGRRGAAVVAPLVQRTDGLFGWPAIGFGVTASGDAFANFGGWWSREEGGVSVRYPTANVVLE